MFAGGTRVAGILPWFSQSFHNSVCCNLREGPGDSIFCCTPVRCCCDSIVLSAGACFVSDAQAKGPSAACDDAVGLAVLASPIAPWKGAPLRVVFTAEKPLEGELSLIAPDGTVAAKSAERHGGPPYFWFAEVASPAAGTWHATLARAGAPAECGTITREIAVRKARPAPPGATKNSVWPVRDTWNRGTENLYSAWIETLFDAPLEEELSWKALHEVLRDLIAQFPVQPFGPARGREGARHSPRLRRPSLLPARLFRVQDGAAVRVLEVHARRRRPAAEVPPVVEHREGGASSRRRPRRRPRPTAVFGLFGQPARAASGDKKCRSRPTGARAGIRILPAHDRRQRRPFRQRANGGRRRRHRLLSRAAEAGDAAPGHHLRRSLWAHLGDRQAHRADGRRGGRAARRRRATRRNGRAQAFLARQFPVRAGPRARRAPASSTSARSSPARAACGG